MKKTTNVSKNTKGHGMCFPKVLIEIIECIISEKEQISMIPKCDDGPIPIKKNKKMHIDYRIKKLMNVFNKT